MKELLDGTKDILLGSTYDDDFDFDLFLDETDASLTFEDWLEFMKCDAHEQFVRMLDNLEGSVKVNGTLGLWDGEHVISETPFDNIRTAFEKCLGDDGICFRAFLKDGLILLEVQHHDGWNRFSISKDNGKYEYSEIDW